MEEVRRFLSMCFYERDQGQVRERSGDFYDVARMKARKEAFQTLLQKVAKPIKSHARRIENHEDESAQGAVQEALQAQEYDSEPEELDEDGWHGDDYFDGRGDVEGEITECGMNDLLCDDLVDESACGMEWMLWTPDLPVDEIGEFYNFEVDVSLEDHERMRGGDDQGWLGIQRCDMGEGALRILRLTNCFASIHYYCVR